MKQPITAIFGGEFSKEMRDKINENATAYFFADDSELLKVRREVNPQVYVTIGKDCFSFPELLKLPLGERQKWLHFVDPMEVVNHPDKMTFCFVSSSISQFPSSDLISVFITSYNSGEMIKRPINTLLAQTYQNWEAVIVDDSNGNANWQNMIKIKEMDPLRIRIYRSEKNSGVIGQVKNLASSLCRGYLIMEMDHDDDLEPQALQRLHDAAQNFPEAGFFYSDFCEIHEGGKNFSYGEYFAIGYGGYRKEWSDKYNKWINVAVSCPITAHTIRYLVSCPNHYRAFRATVLRAMGGWNPNFHVADDYEVIVRAFLNTTMVRIPYHSYFQYRNSGGNNYTFIRNQEIQKLWRTISNYYNKQISDRVKALTVSDDWSVAEGRGQDPAEYNMTTWTSRGKIWLDDRYDRYFHRVYSFREKEPMPLDADEPLGGVGGLGARGKIGPLVSVVVGVDSGKSRADLLKMVALLCGQSYQNLQIMIVGFKCPVLEPLMDDLINKFTDPEFISNPEFSYLKGLNFNRIKRDFNWWNFEDNPTLASCLNYAVKLVSTGSLTFVVDMNALNVLLDTRILEDGVLPKLKSDPALDAVVLSQTSNGSGSSAETRHVVHRTLLYRKHGTWKPDRDLLEIWKSDPTIKIEK